MYQMLAVDDTKAERDCVAFLVNEYRLPVRLEMAKDGQEAAEMLERKRYDILFTDIRMPRRDGLELSRHALSLNPEMKVILFSGYHDFTYAKQAIGMGVTDYLLKPINTEEFRGVLQKTLEDIQRQERRLRQFRKHILQLLLNAADASDLRAQYGDALDFLDAASAVCLLEMNDANLNSLPVDLEEYLCGILPEGFIYLDTNQTQSLLLVLGEQAFDGGG